MAEADDSHAEVDVNEDDPRSEIISSRRLESFSDGVMAVIITVMAFNLHPPSTPSWSAVEHRVPTLLIYVLSFTVIGVYWNNHHHLLRITTTINSAVMWTNLALLLCLSLFPVVTEWVGLVPSSSWPAVAYGLVSTLCAVAYYVLSRAILRANHHDRMLVRALGHDVKGRISLALALVGVALAFVSAYLAYACYAVLTVMWFVPDRRLVRPHRH